MPRLSMWEVCAEVGNKFPVWQVNEQQRGVFRIVVLSLDDPYVGVDVLPPSLQGQLPQDCSNVAGCADTEPVGPSMCRRAINIRVGMRQGSHIWCEEQALHE